MKTDDAAQTSNVLTYPWLAGILVVLVMALTSAWGMDINTRVNRMENTVAEIKTEIREFMGRQTEQHRAISEKMGEIVTALKEMRQ
ncbi:MAG: hypothetical protein HZC54_00705 [Verrucomicrobia bacterium]|nr:hypothetical protein [Verrucomicrobiota bacterium]